MSVSVVYGQGENDIFDFGSLLLVYPALSEVAKIVGTDPEYDELQSIPCFAEQPITPWWLQQVALQAAKFLSSHGKSVSEECREFLAIAASATELPIVKAQIESSEETAWGDCSYEELREQIDMRDAFFPGEKWQNGRGQWFTKRDDGEIIPMA